MVLVRLVSVPDEGDIDIYIYIMDHTYKKKGGNHIKSLTETVFRHTSTMGLKHI